MPQFEKLDGTVVLRSRGRYQERPIYARGNVLFAKYGASFIRLKKDGGTSVDKVFWDDLDGLPNHGFDPVTTNLVLTPAQLTRIA